MLHILAKRIGTVSCLVLLTVALTVAWLFVR